MEPFSVSAIFDGHPGRKVLAAVLLLWLLLVFLNFRGAYHAERFRLKPERNAALRWGAYVAALPLRLALAGFAAGVTALVWGLVAFFFWAMWKVAQG